MSELYKCGSCGSKHTEGNKLCHCGGFLWRESILRDDTVVMAADLETVVKSKVVTATAELALIGTRADLIASKEKSTIKNSWVTGK